MTRTGSTRAASKSRRRFLKVVAMGSVAALASAVLLESDASGAPRREKPTSKPAAHPAPRTPAIEAEVAKQKKSTADILKTIRDYELPAGSEMAFVFSPARASKRRPRAAAPRGGAR